MSQYAIVCSAMAHMPEITHFKYWLYVFSVISGILIGVAFTTPQLWWCAFPGVALFVYGIESGKNLKSILLASLITGTVKAGIALSWSFTAYPADWLGGPTVTQQIVLLGGTWLLSTLSVGLGFVFVGFLAFHIRHQRGIHKLFLYPLFFILGDMLGALCFSIYTYGDGNPINAYFGFSMLGYTLADHSILKHIASLGGVYGLTYTLAFLSSALYIFVHRIEKYRTPALVACVLLFYVSGLVPLTEKSEKETIVAAITTNFQSSVSISKFELAIRQKIVGGGIEVALARGAKTVLLPEDIRFGEGRSTAETLAVLKKLPHSQDAVIVDSARIQLSPTTAVLRGFLYDIDGNSTYTTDKQFVVPVGEYLPWIHKTAIALLGGLDYFEGMQYIGSVLEITSDAPLHVPNVLFCFESGIPNIAFRKTQERRSNLIVHPVSHGWFHTPRALWNEERQMLVVQALHSQTPILQAGNNAPSVLYHANGTVDTGTVILHEQRMTVTLFKM